METALMTQYAEMKRKHPDAILLFRINDFYEMFGEDAVAGSQILGITLTSRANGSAERINLAGFPHHALDTYLPELVRAGRRVAICEPIEDPNQKRPATKANATHDGREEGIPDLAPLFMLLASFYEIMGIVYDFAEIRRMTGEIRALSRRMKIEPRLAFSTCCDELERPRQKSLFD